MTTPLGRVRGLGSGKTGTTEYVAKQFSGFVLAVLTPYVIVIVLAFAGRPYHEVVSGLKSLWVSPPLLAFLLASLYHMRIGMKVIIEDYVHAEHPKTVALAINWCFCWGLAVLLVFAILRIFTT